MPFLKGVFMRSIRHCIAKVSLLLAGMVGLLGSPFSALAQEPAAEPVVQSVSEPVATSPSTQPADSGAQVSKLIKDLGLPADVLRENDPFSIPGGSSEMSKGSFTGTVMTEDGSELPANSKVQVVVDVKHRYKTARDFPIKGSSFSGSIEAGTIWVVAKVPGWASVTVGPLELTADKPLDDISLVLSRGRDLKIHAVDADGKPALGVTISIFTTYGNMTMGSDSIRGQADGNVNLSNLSGDTVRLMINADGYFRQERIVDLTETQELEICLARRSPITGTVVNKSDGKPIANASIYTTNNGEDYRQRKSYDPNFQPVAQTDEQGHFHLISDHFGETILTVLTPDKRVYSVLVRDGQDVICRMPEPLYVKGHIKGDRSKLAHTGNQFIINVVNSPLIYGLDTRMLGVSQYQLMANDVGGKVEFEIFPVWPGQLQIGASQDLPTTIDVSKPIDDLEIDVDQEPVIDQPHGDAAPVPLGQVGDSFTDALTMLTMPTLALAGQVQTFDGPAPAGTVTRAVPAGGDGASGLVVPEAKRDVILKLTPPPGCSQLTGVVRVQGVGNQVLTLGIKDNQVQFQALPSQHPVAEFQWIPGAIALPMDFDVPAGKDALMKTVKLNPAGAVHIKVVDEAGEPVADVNPNALRNTEDMRGELGFQGYSEPVPTSLPGEYFYAPMQLGVPVSFYVLRNGIISRSALVTLTAAQPVQEVTLVLKKGRSLKVHLLDPDGKPMPGTETNLYWVTLKNHYIGGQSFRTDGHSDLLLERVDPDGPLAYLLVGNNPGIATDCFKLEMNQPEQTFQLARGLRVHGVVVEATSGRPLINAAVYANATQDAVFAFSQGGAFTNDKGEFEFTTLAPGQYTLQINTVRPKPQKNFPGLGDGEGSFPTITAGQAESVKIQVMAIPGNPFPYPLGDAPATQPTGSSAQPSGAATQPAAPAPSH